MRGQRLEENPGAGVVDFDLVRRRIVGHRHNECDGAVIGVNRADAADLAASIQTICGLR